MAAPKIPNTCDVVVIGAGMSGLVSGALLSRSGLDVTIVDSQHRPGGYLAGFHRKKFVFDSAIHWLNQCGPQGSVHRILSHIGDDFPQSSPLRRIRRYKSDVLDTLLTDDPDELKRTWLEKYPEDRKGIEQFFKDAYVIGERMSNFADFMRTRESMSWFEKVCNAFRMIKWGFPFRRLYKLSAEEGLERYFKNEDFKKVFASELDILSVIVPVGWAYHHDFQAPPKGGSQVFPRWLVSRIESSGSRVILGRRVKQVCAQNGSVGGVVLEAKGNGAIPEQTITSRYVVAACDLLTLYEKLLPPDLIDSSHLERLRNMDLYGSSVTISLGLDCPVETLGFNEEMWVLTRSDVPRTEQSDTDPEKCAISILAPTHRDPSLAPEGKGTLTLYTTASMSFGDKWKTGPDLKRGEAYKAFKQDYADTIISRVEKNLGIDIRSHIEVMEVATPITHWRYTGNRNGTIMASRPTPWNIKNKVARYHTPVERLFVSGHWAEYGGGVPVATRAGANAALLVLKEANPVAFRDLCSAMAGESKAKT